MPCKRSSYPSCRSQWSYSLLFVLLLLLAAGPALSAQPAARKPLPETAVLDRVDGRLLRVDANDVWLFELTMEVKTPDYQVPAGTHFMLLPSVTLGRLIADVNDRFAPRYRLSARVTRYKGKNFLFPTYYLPLSKFKDDKSPEDSDSNPQPVIRNPRSGEPELAVPPEILEQLKKQRPLRGPRKGSQAEEKPASTSPDRVLVDCIGRIQSSQLSAPSSPASTENRQPATDNYRTGLVFVPYALGWNLSDVHYELLPCAALEQAQQRQAQVLDPIRFNVAGLVTEFKGRKYLLLQRAVVVYNYGNFGR
jgi:hypothetical protein